MISKIETMWVAGRVNESNIMCCMLNRLSLSSMHAGVVSALRAWGATNAEVAIEGCLAIANLSCNSAANRERLRAAGAQPLLVAVIAPSSAAPAEARRAATTALRELEQ